MADVEAAGDSPPGTPAPPTQSKPVTLRAKVGRGVLEQDDSKAVPDVERALLAGSPDARDRCRGNPQFRAAVTKAIADARTKGLRKIELTFVLPPDTSRRE
jgi:hypothetical protein